LSEKQEPKLCKCGKSNDKPYCDGSHKVKKIDKSVTDTVSDEDFAVFMRALFGPYVGPSWCAE
jgi:CDGSH-type Zn-finger protein